MRTTAHIRNEHGMALVGLVIIIVILAIVAYGLVASMTAHQQTSSLPFNSLKAFYLSEGALEIGKKYIVDQEGETPGWAPDTDLFIDEPLGDGTINLAIHWESGVTFVTFTASASVSN